MAYGMAMHFFFFFDFKLARRCAIFVKGYLFAVQIIRLINHHSRRHLTGDVGRQLGRLLFFASLLSVDMRLQPLVEVGRAQASVDDGHHDQDEGDDGEESKRSPSRKVFPEEIRLVHSNELE